MADRNRVADKSSMHRYRIELPILLDDMGLSVYAFRLYVHIKRRAGDGGSCYEGARALAKACRMSPGQVSKAKDELAALGLIQRDTKSTRGGMTDDIAVVDIWPRNFRTYTREESDQEAITHEEVIATRSLSSQSDRTVITSGESDQEAITLSSKRSPGDRKNHDHDVGVGDRARAKKIQSKTVPRHVAYLAEQGMTTAPEFEGLDAESCIADFDARRADGIEIAAIVTQWRISPPRPGAIYERRPIQSKPAPDQRERPAVAPRPRGRHAPTGGSELRDPGWMDRLIEQAEKGDL